ncbi:MAG: hypothetical protein K0A98_04145 [Trueperaceae bacterium]|nr:hypothetical protein [Trueperaceae bacterium]
MTQTRALRSIRPGILGLTAVLAIAPLAAAADAPTIDASGVLFADATVAEAGIDLDWADGLVVTLGAPGDGALGDASYSPASDLPTNALGGVVTAQALGRTGLVVAYPSGVAFVTTATSVDGVTAAFAERLASLGFAVEHEPAARSFDFSRGGETYRAVFGAHAEGVSVYLGH